jgi:hypothetical protein
LISWLLRFKMIDLNNLNNPALKSLFWMLCNYSPLTDNEVYAVMYMIGKLLETTTVSASSTKSSTGPKFAWYAAETIVMVCGSDVFSRSGWFEETKDMFRNSLGHEDVVKRTYERLNITVPTMYELRSMHQKTCNTFFNGTDPSTLSLSTVTKMIDC